MALLIQSFTFNMYAENTWVVADETGACIIIDPGCYSREEEETLRAFIESRQLTVEALLNTHGHIDHMLGNRFVKDRYGVPLITHEKVTAELEAALAWGPMMGVRPAPSPVPNRLVKDGDTVTFGHTILEVLFTPGHSEGHISFFHRESGHLFSGDVLFAGSIGRTDLPGGDFPTLMQSIFTKLLPLGDAVIVHSGHGPDTTIGRERRSNPFLQAPA